jgi:hypothetical protein
LLYLKRLTKKCGHYCRPTLVEFYFLILELLVLQRSDSSDKQDGRR